MEKTKKNKRLISLLTDNHILEIVKRLVGLKLFLQSLKVVMIRPK